MRRELRYIPIAGVVPCSAGWLVQPARLLGVTVVPEDPYVLPTLVDVLDYRPSFTTIALGAPIGLVDEPNGGYRRCDLDARVLLGWPRRSLVARVPSRATLYAPTFEAAVAAEPWLTELNYRHFHRLREVDEEIQPYHQRTIYSAHPELSFWDVNGEAPVESSPFWPEGPADRIRLLEDRVPGVRAISKAVPPGGATLRQVVDAAGLLWTARRIAGRVIGRLPEDPEWDAQGRRIELVR